MNNTQIILKVSMVFIMLLFGASLFAEWQSDNGDGTFKNPPLYADYPDPSIIRVDDTFYLATTTFANSPGLRICTSKDLVNWEIAGHCISSFPSGGAYDMIGGNKYGNGVFAPSIAYKDGTFYVVVTPNGESTRIYYTNDVYGSWNVHQFNAGYFDPCLFIEDNGTPYLAWGGAWENSIKMIQLNSNLSGTVGSQKTILSYSNIEGTHLSKVNNTYYLFNAVPAQRLVCSRSNNVWGPYGETTTLCQAGRGGHQGGMVDLPDGSYWGYLQQDDGAPGRMTRICPITWENNWPRFGRTGNLGTVESSYTKPIQNQPIKVPAASDEFNNTSLGKQWMWNHNPDNSRWSLTGSALRLRATTASNFWNARNSLTQKGQGLMSSGSIRIDRSNMQSGDIGGLGMLGDPRGYIAVNGNRIIMSEEDSTKATVDNIAANILYFRVEMNFSTKQATFYWKDDTRDWQRLGTSITMGFDWQNGTFQGEQYAILCFNPSGSSGYMDVDWFRLDDKPGPGGDPTAVPTIAPTPVPPQQEPIFSGGPYSLNGTSDYVDLPDGLTNDLTDFSIACKVNLNSIPDWVRIFDFGGDTNIFMMLTPASGTTGNPYFCITLTGNDGEQGLNGPSALPTGSDQHFAITKSGSTAILYINGQEVDRNTNMTLNPADMGNTTNNYIGRSQWEQDPYLNGEVDEFVVYNRALSASEVADLANSSEITPEPTTTPTPPPGDCNVSFNPANSTQGVNSTFRIDVVLDSGNQELAAYGFTITYNDNILSVVDVEEGAEGFLSASNTGNPGEIIASGFDTSGTGPGSDLQIIIITFNAIAEGTSSLGLYVDQLVDGATNTIGSACGNDGSVVVTDVMQGDTNGDGTIDIIDALLIAQYYVDLDPADFIPENADVNCDGSIDIVDALLVAQYYVELINTFC